MSIRQTNAATTIHARSVHVDPIRSPARRSRCAARDARWRRIKSPERLPRPAMIADLPGAAHGSIPG